jgi:hypothetical protein
MLGVGVVPFTMESLGVYLFAGAFRFLGALRVLPCGWPESGGSPNVLMQKGDKQAAIDALLPAGLGLAN